VVAAPGRDGGNEVNMAARGKVTIDVEECKGCGLCVDSCPPECLKLAPELSAYGVHPARYTGEGCTGCGICFYCCPEPGALTVYRLAVSKKAAQAPTTQTRGSHAPAL
jgi:2-oxoglutarate ferredoxin oxidoreductase subunit delta